MDAIWHAAGDRSADFSWYTKRAILAAVYSATVLYWLRDTSEDDAATLAFLDRRLAGIGRIGRLRGRAERLLARLPRPRRRECRGELVTRADGHSICAAIRPALRRLAYSAGP